MNLQGFLIASAVVTLLNLLLGAHLHGRSRDGERHNFFINLVASSISWLLIWIFLL